MNNSEINFRLGIEVGKETVKFVVTLKDEIIDSQVLPNTGQPLKSIKNIFKTVSKKYGISNIVCGITESGINIIPEDFNIDRIFEIDAWVETANRYYPDIEGIIDIGKTYKYLSLKIDPATKKLIMDKFEAGGSCAASCGDIIPKMTARLNYKNIPEFSEAALNATNPVPLASKCQSFAESDVIGSVNGRSRKKDDAAAGICISICERFAKNKSIIGKVAYIGGTSDLSAMVFYLKKELGTKADLFVPEYNRVFSAIGAAFLAQNSINIQDMIKMLNFQIGQPYSFESWPQLKLEKSIIMQEPPRPELPKKLKTYFVTVDTGSFSTKSVGVYFDEHGNPIVIAKSYVPTGGDPIGAVQHVIADIEKQTKEQGFEIEKIIAATTGSGRHLTGNFIGANLIKNEITAQAASTRYYAKLLGLDIEYIIELGGQDGKGINLGNGETILNKSCSAGTGGNLSSLADDLRVKIEELGKLALQGKKPPRINSNCTVFINSAIDLFKLNNVSTPDLLAAACYAVADNYIQKVAGTGIIGKRVAFQGAPAKIEALIAAFEALLKQPVFVPPLPEFTGAIGAACLAYEMNPEVSNFRGFEKIISDPCERGTFECKDSECSDHCMITTLKIDGKIYYYGDRCGKRSENQKENLGKHLPNLVEEYQKLLLESSKIPVPEGAEKIGCPWIGLAWDYYPLYNFMRYLGFDLVPSGPNKRKTIEIGINKTVNNMCLPVETAIGCVSKMADEGFSKIFIPRIISLDQPDKRLSLSQACPYWQGAPDFIPRLAGVEKDKIISPVFHLEHGQKHIRNAFIRFGQKELGKTAKEAGTAFDKAWEDLIEFRKKVAKRGQEVLEQYKNQKICFISGRSYALFDPEVSIKIIEKVQQFGVLAFPQQFLPLDDVDISDTYSNLYTSQGQKKLKFGRLIREKFNSNKYGIINFEVFGCAPDSFLVPWLSDEAKRNILKINIDAPTTEANILTRIEAHLDWMDLEKIEEKPKMFTRIDENPIEELGDSTLWIPNMYRGAKILAACLHEYGINAQVLPKSPDHTLSLARQANPYDICLPSLMLTEDMLYRTKQPDFNSDEEAFLRIAAKGPCRLYAYTGIDRKALDKLGFENVPIVTLGSKSSHGGLDMKASILAWDMLVAHDMLQKMLLKTRPYEVNKGESQELYEKFVDKLVDLIPKVKKRIKLTSLLLPSHLKIVEDFLSNAAKSFTEIEISQVKKPRIGVIGEFYVRGDEQANDNLIRNLEKFGAEVFLAPSTEFLGYSVAINKVLSKNRLKEIGLSKKECEQFIAQSANTFLATRDEHKLHKACLPLLEGDNEMSSEELIQKGSKVVNYNFGGEFICSVGKSLDFVDRGYDGIALAGPFNCVPSMITESMLKNMGKELNDIPILANFYDGFPNNTRDQAIAQFMRIVTNRFEQKNKLLEV